MNLVSVCHSDLFAAGATAHVPGAIMTAFNFPLLRPEIVLEPRYMPGLYGDQLQYVAFDPVTAAECWIPEAEGHIMRALQQLKGPLNRTAIAGYIKLHFDAEIQEPAVDACLARLGELQWLTTTEPAAAIRDAYWETRREVQRGLKLQRLKTSVKRMRKEVPYYRSLLERTHLTEEDIHELGDLRKFPRLSKAQLREHFDTLHPDSLADHQDWWGDLVWRSSSGSSGARTQTLAGVENYSYTLFETLGVLASPRPSRQCLIIPPACTGATCHMDTAIPYENRILFGNTLLMNAFRNATTVSDARMEEYVEEIERFQPVGLMGAGSYMYPLARYIKRTKRRVPKLRFIHLHVEVCSRIHRRLLEEVFDCPVEGCYVSSEMGFAAVECSCGTYHAGPGVQLEVLVGNQPAQPGQLGRLVATTLTAQNRLTPLLRYELGDLAIAAQEPCTCSPLGHLDTVGVIQGRASECIRSVEGRIITPRILDDALTDGSWCANIAYYCLIQQELSRYILEVVPEDREVSIDESGIKTALHRLLGESAEIEIKLREEISPTLPAGRYRLCYSLLDDSLPELP